MTSVEVSVRDIHTSTALFWYRSGSSERLVATKELFLTMEDNFSPENTVEFCREVKYMRYDLPSSHLTHGISSSLLFLFSHQCSTPPPRGSISGHFGGS